MLFWISEMTAGATAILPADKSSLPKSPTGKLTPTAAAAPVPAASKKPTRLCRYTRELRISACCHQVRTITSGFFGRDSPARSVITTLLSVSSATLASSRRAKLTEYRDQETDKRDRCDKYGDDKTIGCLMAHLRLHLTAGLALDDRHPVLQVGDLAFQCAIAGVNQRCHLLHLLVGRVLALSYG